MPLASVTTRNDRLPEIDWLKGFAILSVLFIHAQLFDGHLWFAHVMNRAVGIFLVLFGVTSELWWEGEVRRGTSAGERVRSWYGRRLGRLMLVVWASLGLWWGAVAWLRLPGVQLIDGPHLLASALGYAPWVGTTWFVTLVLQLVVVFPLIRVLLPARGAWLVLVAASALCIACSLYSWDVMGLGRRWFGGGLGVGEPGFAYFWMFAPRVMWHVLGGAYLAQRWGGRPPARITWIAAGVALLGVPLAAYLRDATADTFANNLRTSALYYWLDVPLTLALLGAFRSVPLPRAVHAGLAFCGRASWGIYLGQVLVDELIHLLRMTPRGEGEGPHAMHMLVLLTGACGLVLLGSVLRDRARRLIDRVRGRARPDGERRDGLSLARGLALLASALSLLGLSALAMREWFPALDNALIWMHTSDVGGAHTPLTGVYSRFGWTHPGPALYYALALPLHLLDARPSGLLVSVVLIALAASVALVLRLAKRAGASAALLCAAGMAALATGMGEHVISPWNPFLLVFPFALFVAAIWLWTDGDDASLPIAALAGSFAVQLHVGVVPVMAMLIATAVGLRRKWMPLAPTPTPQAPRSALVTECVLVAMWAPPLIAELTAPSSNLLRIGRFFLSSKQGDVIGYGRGLGIAAAELAPWGSWVGRQRLGMMADMLPAPIWQLLVPLGCIAITAAIGKLRRDHSMLRLSILLCVAVLACIFSYAHIHGLAFSYLAMWTRAIAMFCLAAPLIALVRIWDTPDATQPSRSAAALSALAVAVLLAAFARGAFTAPLPDAFQSHVVERFANVIAAAVPEHTQVRAAALGTPYTVSTESVAIVLLRAGRDARMQCSDPSVPGPHRCAAPGELLPTVALASGPGIDIYRKKGARVLAEFDPLWPAQRAEAAALCATLEAQLAAGKREDLTTPLRDAAEWLPWSVPTTVDQATLARYLKLAGGLDHLAFAVFLFPPAPF